MDNEILTTSEPNLEAIGYHFRFTFSDQDDDLECLNNPSFVNRCKLIHKSFISKLVDSGYTTKLTSGFEVRNKAGENCKAHFHVAFKSKHIKQSMNRAFKRYLMDTYDQEYLGNKCYSFKEQHIRCEDEFWRYPIKQSLDKSVCRGISDQILENLHNVAKESYAKVCQVHQARMDKKDKDDTLYLRCLSKCKKLDNTTPKSLAKTFYEVYIEEKRPINHTVIRGYVELAKLELGIITLDELLISQGY